MKYPQLLGILPKDMIAVPWDYDAKPSYDSIIKPYRDAGLRVIVAPGANNWNQLWPDLDVGYINIRNFVRDGQKLGAMGMLNTTWNDDGEALYGMAWPTLIFGAAAGWQAGESSIDQFKNAYDWAFYRNARRHLPRHARESRPRPPGAGENQSRNRDRRSCSGSIPSRPREPG